MESEKRERSEQNEAVMKRFKAIHALGSTVKTSERAPIAIAKKKGAQCRVMVVEQIGENRYGPKYLKFSCVVICGTENGTTLESFPVSGQFSPLEEHMPGFDKNNNRPPIIVNEGDVKEIVTFQDGTALVKKLCVGMEVFVNGLNFSVGHYKPGPNSKPSAYEDQIQPGDPTIEWVAGTIAPVRLLSPDEIAVVLSKTKIGRVETLPGGKKTPFPDDIERIDMKYKQYNKEVIINRVVVHWALSNELLLSRGRSLPTVFLHLDNTFHYWVHHLENMPVTKPGPLQVVSNICDYTELSWKNKEEQDIFGFSGPKEYNKSLRLTSVDTDTTPADFFGKIQTDDVNTHFGIYDIHIWRRCAQQLLRGLDCCLQLKIDRQKSECLEDSEGYFLIGFMNFVSINYPKTFNWSGMRVPMKTAIEILARNTYEDSYNGQVDINTTDSSFTPSPASLELINDPNNQTIRCLCLNEFKGDVGKVLNDAGWNFYVVPFSDFHSTLKEARQFHEKQLFFEKNNLSEEERIQEVLTKYCKDDNNRVKLTIFAHRV